MHLVELLAPAKNLECGLAAVNHGADAVYIGAPRFGARAAAGNSLQDIEQLCRYAHRFRAKVLIALNTLLTDDELLEAEKLAWSLYEAGADALILQDMGLLEVDLPPMALHASTQTDNRTAERVVFLQQAGFSRVVLARELSLAQIADIASRTEVELEAFVHGALCVSYSGQCYISQAMCGRSANRGACAQYCRLPYDLEDADGTKILRDKHLLSLKDLDLSDFLFPMMQAGVSSFKIEGRLKDLYYVKNITAYYRRKLDAILDKEENYKQASSGKTRFFFEPDPAKTFRRGSTDYFFDRRKSGLTQPDTPKSMGETFGTVTGVGRNYIDVSSTCSMANGDGVSFFSTQGNLSGFRVNRVEGRRIFPASMPALLKPGDRLYRNQDAAFEKLLEAKSSERHIALKWEIAETDNGFRLIVEDKDNVSVARDFDIEKQAAHKPEEAVENILRNLSKLGDTIYQSESLSLHFSKPYFIPASRLSAWRRELIADLDAAREKGYRRPEKAERQLPSLQSIQLDYRANVLNRKAKLFYEKAGAQGVMPAFEAKAEEGVPLMFCKFCIKYEMGCCPKLAAPSKWKEPWFLKHNNQRFKLFFDCKRCEMQLFKA